MQRATRSMQRSQLALPRRSIAVSCQQIASAAPKPLRFLVCCEQRCDAMRNLAVLWCSLDAACDVRYMLCIVCGDVQISFLNKAMQNFGTSQIVPVYYVFFTFFAIAGELYVARRTLVTLLYVACCTLYAACCTLYAIFVPYFTSAGTSDRQELRAHVACSMFHGVHCVACVFLFVVLACQAASCSSKNCARWRSRRCACFSSACCSPSLECTYQ